jgi:hypothetical protein
VTGIALAVAEARTQTGSMVIDMAGQTLSALDREIIAHIGLRALDVALFTFMLDMGSKQGIARFLAMIEGRRGLPFFRCMTEAAFILLKLALEVVHIIFHVTLVTGSHKANITRIVLPSGFFRALCGMTLHAIRFCVSTFQRKTRLAVVKGLGIDIHGIEIPTLVILMAVDAGLIAHQPVEVLLGLNILTNFLVALHAILVRNPASRLVALQTILMRMLQIIVTNRERPRRQELVEEAFEFRLGFLGESRGCSQE